MRLRRFWTTIWLVGFTAVQNAALGETDSAAFTPRDIHPATAGIVEGTTIHLSLADALRLMLERNLDLELAHFFPLLQREEVRFERGSFDPDLNTFLSYTDSETQAGLQAKAIFQADSFDTRTLQSGISIGKRFRTGTFVETGIQYSREDFEVPIFSNTEHNARGYVSVNQPILRGAGTEYNTARIRIAENREEASWWEFQDRVEQMLAATEKAYWQLVTARSLVDISAESLRLAKSQLNIASSRFQAGAVIEVDVLEAQSQVAAREADLLSAKDLLDTQENLMRILLRLTGSVDMWEAYIYPINLPDATLERPDLNWCIEKAFKHRRDYRAQKLGVEAGRIRLSAGRRDLLPRFDLFAEVATSGLDERAGRAFEIAAHTDYYGLTAGFQFSYALGNRRAEAQSRQAEISLDQTRVSVERLEDQIIREVRDSWRKLETERLRIESTQTAELLAEKKLTAQQNRYVVGRATSHEVFQFVEDLTRARVQVVLARVQYLNSVVDLYRAMGMLADYRGVLVE